MESEFFGHKHGSFTGAVADKKGLVQSAEGGTLFLDEVADLPLHMQVKLLRADPGKDGAARRRHAGAAGRRAHAVGHAQEPRRSGRGRAFPRGPVLPHQRHRAAVPPLRERRDDIPELAASILARLARRMGTSTLPNRRQPRSRRCAATPSPATCASSRTCSSARWPCAPAAVIDVGDLQLRAQSPSSADEDERG